MPYTMPLDVIQQARERIRLYVRRTPLAPAPRSVKVRLPLAGVVQR